MSKWIYVGFVLFLVLQVCAVGCGESDDGDDTQDSESETPEDTDTSCTEGLYSACECDGAMTGLSLCEEGMLGDCVCETEDGHPALCGTCHGDMSSPMPTESGAHGGHGTVDCESCHTVPVAGDAEHVDGMASVLFGGLATADGATPEYDTENVRCDGTYCHGATIADGANPNPAWDDEGPLDCGSCHGFPPTTGHPNSVACEGCHSPVWDGTDFVDPDLHVNGTIEVGF